MRILVAHNRYKYAGGEDSVMRAEVDMLRSAGHMVELFEADNSTIQGTLSKIAAAGSLFHSSASASRMSAMLRAFRPQILHIHNWFPLLSPSIVAAANVASVPVVQTLHNFRMFCANGVLYRDGRLCDECAGKALPLGGIVHKCYSGSRIGSALVTAAFTYHRLAHTWDGVSTFIAVSQFQRDLLIRGGVPAAQIVVKPNFVKDPGVLGEGTGGYALFVGRLTAQKGILTVLDAWEHHGVAIPLRIMGGGPLKSQVVQRVAALRNVEYMGQRSQAEVFAAMADARFLVFASESYESFALAIVEAFSCGTPVLAADMDSVAELVRDRQTGLRFTPADPAKLAAKAALFIADTELYCAMRRQSRTAYEQRYTEPTNYRLLMDIYDRACQPSLSRTCQTI